MEFTNYEREVKYLLTEDNKTSINQIAKYLSNYGYNLIQSIPKEKHETFFDDDELTLTRRGDALKSCDFVSARRTAFMYKKNVSNPEKPYVSKYELRTDKFNNINSFISQLDLSLKRPLVPIMHMELMRDTVIVEKNNERFLISYDNTYYYNDINLIGKCEDMIEVEEWTIPNAVDRDLLYDALLCEINDILLNGDLPFMLTKDSKPYRGQLLLKGKNFLR
jgi:hypothetical protein